MKKLLTSLLCAAMLFSIFGTWTYASAAETAEADGTAAAEDTLLIKFVRGSGKDNLPELSGSEQIGEISGLGVTIMKVKNPKAVAALVKHNKHIEYAEPDYLTETEAITPNDPNFGRQTYLKTANTPEGWSTTTGAGGIIVAVIDSGVLATHDDLKGRVVAGYDFYNRDNDATDDYGHGTKVAGIIAASGNNSVGIAGINWDAKIMPLKTTDSRGSGTVSAMASAIIYAVDNGAKVINISMGTTADSATLKSAVNYAESRNVVVVSATGNSNTSVAYPARYDSVIGVGNLETTGARNTTSNYGSGLNVGANGGVYTTTSSGGYASGAGTSFASPQVAGLASLMLSLNPSLTPSNVRDLIQQGAKNDVWSNDVGYGQIDIAATLGLVGGAQPPKTADTVAPVITLQGATTMELTEGGTYVEPGFSANDAVDGDVTAKVVVSGTVDSAFAGDYTLSYFVSDAAGNQATAVRKITVKTLPKPADNPPVITQIGSNPIILHLGGSSYVEQGAVATDVKDGDISKAIVTTGNVDTSRAGTYKVTYAVKNSAGLSASITREVRVLAPTEVITRTPYSFSSQGKTGSEFEHSVNADADGTMTLNISGLNKTSIIVSVVDSEGTEVSNKSFSGNSSQDVWVEAGAYKIVVSITEGKGNCSYSVGLLMPEVITTTFTEEEVPLAPEPETDDINSGNMLPAILMIVGILLCLGVVLWVRRSKATKQ